MAGSLSGFKRNIPGILRGSIDPVRNVAGGGARFGDSKSRESVQRDRAAYLDPLDLGKDPAVPDVPEAPPAPGESPEDQAKREAADRAERRRSRGRASTILNEYSAGGSSASRTLLGSA